MECPSENANGSNVSATPLQCLLGSCAPHIVVGISLAYMFRIIFDKVFEMHRVIFERDFYIMTHYSNVISTSFIDDHVYPPAGTTTNIVQVERRRFACTSTHALLRINYQS